VPGDLAAFHEIMSDPRAMRYWSRPEHATIEETQGFVDFLCACPGNGGDDWVIERDGRAIGKAGAWSPPEVGFLLHPDRWGHGYAYEAMAALMPVLFSRHDVPALTADVDPRNAASLRLLERLGFRETGRAARTLLWRDEWCDSIYLALPRPSLQNPARRSGAAP
jgi:RimJ/RimL family protein N-acetyltransferase